MISLWMFCKFDNTILADLPFPTDETLPYETYIRAIFDRCGELFPYYQDAGALKESVKYWAQSRSYAWQKIFDALKSTYNPIHNYDRNEWAKEVPNITDNRTRSGNGKTVNTPTGTDVSTEFVNGNNTIDWVNRSKQENTPGVVNTDENTYKESDVNTQTGDREEWRHAYGNIGITTTQQMITSEIELRKFNIVEMIAKEFEEKFIIQVY